ncbi:lactosylceramide 4-alpha-galactosyltransferase-like [Amblyomma americanum]
MACAVESAARLHPTWTVHLLSVTDGHSRSEISGPFADMLRAIPNVVVSTITPLEEFQGTPLEPWYRSGVLNTSAYPVEHLADALRLAVIYKRGGVYLDSDVVMLRPLDMLPSFVSQSPAISAPRLEKGDSVSNGFLAFHRGEPFLLELMNHVVKAYIPQAWASIGPLLLRSVTLEYCGKRSVKELVGRWCRSGEDFMVLHYRNFLPVPYNEWRLFFNASASEEAKEMYKESYVLHVYNKMSSRTHAQPGSAYWKEALHRCNKSLQLSLHRNGSF